jgi:hypothetical protein
MGAVWERDGRGVEEVMERHRRFACLILMIAMALAGAASAQARVAHRSRRAHHSRPRQHITLDEALVEVLSENGAAMASEESGSVATVIEIAFPPEFAGFGVHIRDPQLYAKCKIGPRVAWLTLEGTLLGLGPSVGGVQLDGEGLAFVVLEGGESCQSGPTLIEATLEEAPYTAVRTVFTILPPEPEP